jgi:hypothetical protein
MDAVINDFVYHRNGICGQGWHGVLFDVIEDGQVHRMHLTFFDVNTYAVVDLDDPTAPWRGDVILDAVVQAAIENTQEFGDLAQVLQGKED